MPSVLLDGRYLGPKASGVGRYNRELVSEMQRQRPDFEFRFIVRHLGDEAPLKAKQTLAFDHLPYGFPTSVMLGRKLRRVDPVDLYHSPFHVLPVGLRYPALLTLHDAFQFEQNNLSNYPPPVSWVEWAYFLWAIPDSLRRARRVICVSQTTADEIVRRIPSTRDKLRIIPHGVTTIFRKLTDRAEVAQRCTDLTGSSEPFLLSIGGVSPNKNHERMLRAFAAAFPAGSKVRFAVVNRFGSPAQLVALAKELGVAERYISLGSPSDDELVTLLNGASGLLFCSIIEGFGLPILEAMACGCPVVTSNRSCMPEIAGSAALLTDPYDTSDMARQFARLLSEPGLAQELSGRGLERAASFTWHRAAQETLEVYGECLAAG
jgi:glycosyltransferase involved in cell wall biosynthesis